jgi:hypothetical protein
MGEVSTIGLDIAKSVFQRGMTCHQIGAADEVIAESGHGSAIYENAL